MKFLLDWKNQESWGRFCAFVCLVQSIMVYWRGGDVQTQALWLSAATLSYGGSKAPEIVAAFKGWKPL